MTKRNYERPLIEPFSGSPGRYKRADWVESNEIDRWESEWEREREEEDRSSGDDD